MIVRGLLRLDHAPVLRKNALRKHNNEWPEKMDQAGNSRLMNHHQAQAVIDPLLAVHRDIGQPEV